MRMCPPFFLLCGIKGLPCFMSSLTLWEDKGKWLSSGTKCLWPLKQALIFTPSLSLASLPFFPPPLLCTSLSCLVFLSNPTIHSLFITCSLFNSLWPSSDHAFLPSPFPHPCHFLSSSLSLQISCNGYQISPNNSNCPTHSPFNWHNWFFFLQYSACNVWYPLWKSDD